MNRRLVAALILLGVAVVAEPARAQGGMVLFTPYSGLYDPITGPIVLGTSGGGSVTLTAGPLDHGPSYIGRPSAGATTYNFGSVANNWKNRLGAYLNADYGALTFTLGGGFRTNEVSAFINFNPDCRIGFGTPILPGEGTVAPATHLAPCEEPASFRAFRADNTVAVEHIFTPLEASSGVDTGKYFTLTSLSADIASFEVRAARIAVSDINIAPEPSTVVLAASGLLALAGALRVRRRRSS